jgi:hypothetical protein
MNEVNYWCAKHILLPYPRLKARQLLGEFIPVHPNYCPLRMRPAAFNLGAALQEWHSPFKELQRPVKVAGAFPWGDM